MMTALIDEPGKFRRGGVGVTDGTRVIHMAPPAYIRDHEGCRANAIAAALAIPPRTVQRHLAVLKRNGEIVFKGVPKTGGYWCR